MLLFKILSAIPSAFNTCICQSQASQSIAFMFYLCGGVVQFFRDPSYFQLLHFGSFEQLFVEMHRGKNNTVLLTAQNSAFKYIQLRASCNFACTYLNLKDFVCNFTMLQNVTLFRPWEYYWGTLSGLWLCSCLSAICGDQ